MVKKIQYLVVLLSLVALVGGFTSAKKGKGGSIKIIVIDPGHGGKDPGCNGVTHKEKDVSLAVALKLGKLIEENMKDVKVIFTRTTDVFVELEDRAQIANKAKADLFLSIHCNAAGKPVIIRDKKTGKKRVKTYKNKKGKIVTVEKPNPVPFGTETYVMGLKNEEGKMKVATRENSAIFLEDDYEKKYGGFDPESEESYIIMSNYTSAYVIQSANLAVKLQEEYKSKAGRIDKGVHRQSIWVLWRTSMPSILTEIGYLTNPLEEQFLASKEGQDYLAKAIYRGLRKYKDEVEGNKKIYNDDIENQTPLENENIKAGNIPGQKKVDPEDEIDEEEDTKKESEKQKEDVKKDDIVKKEDGAKKDSSSTETKVKKDSVKVNDTKVDTNATAKDIAEKFKKDKEKEKSELKKEDFRPKADIVFKVQFMSSDVEVNLKQEKFTGVVDGSYYKVKTVYKYTSGNYMLMKDAMAHQAALKGKGFKDCFIIAMKNGERIDVNEAKKQLGQ
ncbi:MAG: N-acetylmuramoyl-L-alanine amidase [Bacteroidetes bacterium]|jgi:N-acetylmuramoyl-L-alanine amidase|nr:N-acetylmuramoyl-L-alanine amidase [Bacteroidota bacterium]